MKELHHTKRIYKSVASQKAVIEERYNRYFLFNQRLGKVTDGVISSWFDDAFLLGYWNVYDKKKKKVYSLDIKDLERYRTERRIFRAKSPEDWSGKGM